MSKPFSLSPRPDGTQILSFPDGTQFKMPPATHEDRMAATEKLAEHWVSHCRNCGSAKQPIIRCDGRIVSQCPECNARRILERNYSSLSDEELVALRVDVHASTERRLAVIDAIEARMREMADV